MSGPSPTGLPRRREFSVFEPAQGPGAVDGGVGSGPLRSLLHLKQTLRSLRQSDRRSARWAYQALRSVYKPLQLLVDGRFRSLIVLRYTGGADVHQVSNMTWLDRYPELFAASARLLEKHQCPRLLSYGCSTGEEVITLRRYFPTARIWGVDINNWNLVKCRKAIADPKINFARSDAPEAFCEGLFDVIYCLAVLQRPRNRHPRTHDSSGIYSFEKFDAKLVELDRYLALGGFLIIDSADYRFADSSISENYEPVAGDHAITARRPKYSKNNQRLPGFHFSTRIFRKLCLGASAPKKRTDALR